MKNKNTLTNDKNGLILALKTVAVTVGGLAVVLMPPNRCYKLAAVN